MPNKAPNPKSYKQAPSSGTPPISEGASIKPKRSLSLSILSFLDIQFFVPHTKASGPLDGHQHLGGGPFPRATSQDLIVN